MSGRGAVDSRAKGTKYGGAKVGPPAKAVSWGECEADVVLTCIAAVTAAGDGIVFARTSDGGALSLRVLSDGLVEKWYPDTLAEAMETLRAVKAVAEG